MLLGWLNYFGVKVGGNVQVVVTVIKVGLIAFIIVAGLGFGHAVADPAAAQAAIAPLTFAGFIAALVAALVGVRRVEQCEHGGVGDTRSAKEPAARINWRDFDGNCNLFVGE